MHEDVPTKAIAACFGLAAFVIAVLVGVVVDNPFSVVLTRAVLSMAACSVLGFIVGSITTRTVTLTIERTAAAAKAAAIAAAQPSQSPPAPAPTDGAQPGAAAPSPS